MSTTITPEVGKQQYTLIQSYVMRKYFISTIYRECSAMVLDLWYYETCVFEWDSTTKKTGKMIDIMDSGNSEHQAIDNHLAICKTYSLRNEP